MPRGLPDTRLITTYRCPSSTRIIPIDANRKPPSVEITDSRDNGLRCLRSGNQEFGARCRGNVKKSRKEMRSFVKGSKEERM